MNKSEYNVIRAVYDRFCTRRFALPTKQRLCEVEAVIGATFPADFRKFILEFNGGVFENALAIPRSPISAKWRDGVAVHHDLSIEILCGIDASFQLGGVSDYAMFENNMPLKLLPIGYAAEGTLVLGFGADLHGRIFIKMTYDIPIEVCASISELFALIRC